MQKKNKKRRTGQRALGLLPPQTGKIIPGSGCEARRRRQLGGAGGGRRGAALLASAFGAAAESGGGRGAERRCASEPGHAVVPPRRRSLGSTHARGESAGSSGGGTAAGNFPGSETLPFPLPSIHQLRGPLPLSSLKGAPLPCLPSLRAATLSLRSPVPRRRSPASDDDKPRRSPRKKGKK